jgi:hypothetical protein
MANPIAANYLAAIVRRTGAKVKHQWAMTQNRNTPLVKAWKRRKHRLVGITTVRAIFVASAQVGATLS